MKLGIIIKSIDGVAVQQCSSLLKYCRVFMKFVMDLVPLQPTHTCKSPILQNQ